VEEFHRKYNFKKSIPTKYCSVIMSGIPGPWMSRTMRQSTDVTNPLAQALGIDISPLWTFHRDAAFEEQIATRTTPTHLEILVSLRAVADQRKHARAKFIGKKKVLNESSKQINLSQ